MEENNLKDHSGVEKESSQATPAKPVADPKPVAQAKKGISRVRQFFRSLLIWLGVIAITFLAGVGTYHFTRFVPLEKSFVEKQSALDEAQAELNTVRTEKQKADENIASLEKELDVADAHVDVLQLLADMNEARLALIAKDVEGAKTALESSTDTMNGVLPVITELDEQLAQSMSQRLGLVLSELERDPNSAQIDLELLTRDLLTAEEKLLNQ